MTGHIFLEGEVGDQVNTRSVRNDIASYPQASEWTVHINSGGGDVDEGYAIGSILKNLKKTTAIIGASCASIATYAAHCCDHIVMSPSGDFTIHLPTATIGGNAQDHLNAANRLQRIKDELINRYMTRVSKKGVTREQVSDMIDKETSMSPSEALAMGFVDDVQEKFKAVAKLDQKINMETLTKKEAEGLFAAFGQKLDNLFKGKFKAKNEVPLTLADGSVITVQADDPTQMVGMPAIQADGTPVPDGTYEDPTQGIEIEVAGGLVTDVETEPAENKDMNAKIADLEKQLAAAKAEVTAKTVAEQTTAKKLETFQNQFTAMQKEFTDLKTKTFGEQGGPGDAPNKFLNKDEEEEDEGMAAFGGDLITYLSGRNLIKRSK